MRAIALHHLFTSYSIMAKPKQAEEDVYDEEEEKEMEVEDLTEPRIKSGKEKRTLRVSSSPSVNLIQHRL